jgi:hypothetical protein
MNDVAKTPWDLKPGDVIRRVELHNRYGGSRQGGISPSRQTTNVFIFSDRERGEEHGYFDEWHEDRCFHYTGEGQRGDQEMKGGNKAVLLHREEGRALRVFRGAGDEVTYRGEFELAPDQPWYRTDAPETGRPDVVRQVIVFRLRPLDGPPAESSSPLDQLPRDRVVQVGIEEQNTERTFVQPSHEPYEAERREQKLVRAYRDYMATKGSTIARHLMRPDGEVKPIFSDVFDATRHHLLEAKGTATREAIRMAIGQLADYRRFVVPTPARAVLLPERPRADLEALLTAEGISVVWQVESGSFADNASGRFT